MAKAGNTNKKVSANKAAKTVKTAKKAVKGVNVKFTVRAAPGKTVYLAGSFNDWNPEGKKMADRRKTGVYTASMPLAPGKYEYKFVIDGAWCADPECADFVQNSHGTLNSVITVK